MLVLSASPLVAQTVAFEHVTVIPMDTERLLQDQTVVVREGRIADLGPAASVAVPGDATRVNGRGKFLIPGLAEMHAHIPGARAPREWLENVLFLYVAGGATTIRGMLGEASHLDLQRAVETGTPLGPHIWTSGPSVNGTSVQSPDSAVRTTRYQHDMGYDFMKIHPGLERVVFDALDASADRTGMRFAGHVPILVGVRRALEAKYWSIDHLDGYIEEASGHTGQDQGWFGATFANDVRPATLTELARLTRAAGVWNVPTQTLMESYATAETPEQLAQRPELKYVPPTMRRQWAEWKANARAAGVAQATLDRWIAHRRYLLKALHEAGAGILLGSDAPQVWNVPGFSIHRELAALVAAGLTPFEALSAGTRSVAAFLGNSEDAGTVALGKQADLILLDANPLTDIRNTTRRAGVMLRGRWLPQSEIQARLDRIAASYAN